MRSIRQREACEASALASNADSGLHNLTKIFESLGAIEGLNTRDNAYTYDADANGNDSASDLKSAQHEFHIPSHGEKVLKTHEIIIEEYFDRLAMYRTRMDLNVNPYWGQKKFEKALRVLENIGTCSVRFGVNQDINRQRSNQSTRLTTLKQAYIWWDDKDKDKDWARREAKGHHEKSGIENGSPKIKLEQIDQDTMADERA